MRVVLYAKNVPMTDDQIDEADVVLELDEDLKGFTIKRHTTLSNTRLYPSIKAPHRHMSELKHILLAGVKGD